MSAMSAVLNVKIAVNGYRNANFFGRRVKMLRKMLFICVVLVSGLVSSSWAVYVNDTQTWTTRTYIHNLSDKTLEIGPSGDLTITARVDLDNQAKIIMSGGVLNTTDTLKFPDSSGAQDVQMFINAGTMTSYEIESRAYERGEAMYIGGGTLIVQTGYLSGLREYDATRWIQDNTLQPADGCTDLVLTNLGGGAVQITATCAAYVEFDSAASDGLESVTPALLSVSMSKEQAETVTVEYDVTGGTATEGVDYTVAAGPLTFSPGETVKTISINVVNDGDDEDDETVEVTLLSVSGGEGELGTETVHTYTIVDSRPSVGFESAVGSAEEDAGTADIAVVLSVASAGQVTVDYDVTGGTADGEGMDYTLANGDLQFDPGQIHQTIPITLVDDELTEGLETIELALSSPVGAKLGAQSQHTFRIIDDEASEFTNSLGMKFLLVPAGTFQMGSDSGYWDEKPVHTVTITESFYMQESEVTADQFRLFDPGYSGGGYATGISWHQAVAFAQWLSDAEGINYRLSTEAEWECACRAGTTTPYSSGGSRPSPGTPNPWGLLNMHNSPREWVHDWHGQYPSENQTDPVGPEHGMAKVIRGGGLDSDDDYYARSSNRAGVAPGFAGGSHNVGLRLVMAPMPTTAPTAYLPPFIRQGIRNSGHQSQGPDPGTPYFNQRPMLPIPPDNSSREEIDRIGLHPSFRNHNHSPGIEVCPNGDVLMIIYTSYSEYEPEVSLMGTRFRFGSLRWDMPEPMFDFPGTNDHAPMLWTDGDTLHFFWGCPRLDGADPYPFQWRSSADSGATWDEVKFPNFVSSIGGHSRQPINTAVRVGDTIYVSSDGSGGQSVLWKSDNNGQTWYDPGGRTGGRHTTFVLLNNGDILGMGGKSTNINGYMPKSISDNGAQSWNVTSTPFSWLGGNQRPCVERLASGRLFFCGEFQKSFDCDQPAGFTEYGSLVALSEDEGQTWHIKKLTSALPHECGCWDCGQVGTLGYSAARQAPNGVIHVITSMNHPCQHFEMNEAWVLSGAGPDLPADPGETGTVDQYQQDYPGGGTKAIWGAKVADAGRYLLHGTETRYYENGQIQYEATYYNGQKVGFETYWNPDGIKLWSWQHDQGANTSIWTQYWSNGHRRVESTWRYGGKVAHGRTCHWDVLGEPEAAWQYNNGDLVGGATPCGPDNDSDEDGIGDDVDNCPADPNPDQIDSDGDGIGDVCDDDRDGDGVDNDIDGCPDDPLKTEPGFCGCGTPDNDTDGDGVFCDDNCLEVANPDQADYDTDLVGDACDNCPCTANTDQADTDGNGIGNACQAGAAIELKVDIGCGQVQSGWVEFNAGVCSGAVGCKQNDNLGGTNIDVHLCTGWTSDNAFRSASCSDNVTRDYWSGDNCNNVSDCTQYVTLKDLDAGDYTLTTYYNWPDNSRGRDTVDVTVDGAVSAWTGDYGAAQTESCSISYDNAGKSTVTFTATGSADVVITHTPNDDGGWTPRIYTVGFELVKASMGQGSLDDSDDDGVDDCIDRCPGEDDAIDTDGDSIPDCADNCADEPNADQTNSDSDSHGDACDNCPNVDNEDQADSDGDGVGDTCDCPCIGDMDGDGWLSPGDVSFLVAVLLPKESNYYWLIAPPDSCGDVDDDGWMSPGDVSFLVSVLLPEESNYYWLQCP